MLRRQVTPDEAPAINWFLCICLTGVGLYIVGLALGWIYIDPKEIHVPRWVLALIGLAFVLGGTMPVGSRADLSDRRSRVLLAAVIVAVGLVSNWIMLHPGELPTQTSGFAPQSTGSLIRIHSSHMLWPEKYDPLMTALLWDIPMGGFVLWLLFGGRRPPPESPS